jgi:hypothetical protein
MKRHADVMAVSKMYSTAMLMTSNSDAVHVELSIAAQHHSGKDLRNLTDMAEELITGRDESAKSESTRTGSECVTSDRS